MAAVADDTVEFYGQRYRVADKVGIKPVMRYARAAKRAQRGDGELDGEGEMEMLDATLSLLEQCVHPDDWERFDAHTDTIDADIDDYMEFAGHVMAVMAERPTGRSSDSSDGPQIIEATSPVDSFSQGAQRQIDKLNAEGRPDLALVVRRGQESLTA